MQSTSEKQSIDLYEFAERYNKSVGMICNEYVGKHLVIYKNDEYVVVDSLNEIKEIKEQERVKELYIDGLVITDRKIFHPFKNIEHIHGTPILEITDMSFMFQECNALTTIGIGSWDISNVTVMRYMFRGYESLTSVGDLGGWDTSSCTDMSGMFCGCTSLTSVGDLRGWDTSRVTNMRSMFDGCKLLTSVGDLGGWDTSSVIDTNSMFAWCKSLKSVGDLGLWNTSNITDIESMLFMCNSLSLGYIGGWDTNQVIHTCDRVCEVF